MSAEEAVETAGTDTPQPQPNELLPSTADVVDVGDAVKVSVDADKPIDHDSLSAAAAPPPPPPSPPPPPVRDIPFWTFLIIFFGLAMYLFVCSLDTTILGTSLPAIAIDFRPNLDDLALIPSVFMLTATVLQPVVGKLSDIFGRKSMVVVSTLIFLLGTTLCGVSKNIEMLIGCRVLQGVGAAGAFSLTIIITTEMCRSVKAAGFWVGLLGSTFAIASICGPLVGGRLTDSELGWRWSFYVGLPFGVVSTLLVVIFLRKWHVTSAVTASKMNGGNQTDQTDHEKKKRVFGRIDFLGIITFTVGFVCLMLAVLWGGGRYEWKTPQVIGLYCGFVVLFPLYVYIDLYVAPEPMIPILRLIRLRNYVLSFIINIMAGGCLYGITLFYPIYFQVVIGDHAFDAGMRLLPFMLAVCVAAAVSGWIVSKYGEYRVQIWIGLALATTGTGLTLIWTTESPPYLFTLAPIISGTGYGMVFLTTFTSAQSQLTINQDSDTPENEKNSDGGRSSGSGVYVDDLAAGTALIDFCRTIGGVLSTSILTSALNNSAIALIGDRPDHDQLISAIRKGIGAIIDDLEWGQQLAVLDAYVYGSFMVRLVLTAASGLAFILSLGMKNVPLKDHKK